MNQHNSNHIFMRRSFCHLLFFFCSLFPISLTAQGPLPVEDRLIGFSAERLQRYSGFLEEEVTQSRIPGAVSMVMHHGRIVDQSSYGFSDLSRRKNMKTDDIFHLMSMTKPIVTTAFMMLYEEGHFLLSDPVSKYLPACKGVKVAKDVQAGTEGGTVAADQEITIHQLLTHTAGFSHGLGGTELDKEVSRALYAEPHENIEQRVQSLFRLPLVGQPGAQWNYSASPDVLSLLIEHFSGMTTAQFLQERLFGPLGMTDTGYNIPKEKKERWVPVHEVDKTGNLIVSEQQLPIEGNTVFGGTHGLFSTAGDYMKFCMMMINKGNANGQQFLSPKTVELMTTNNVGDLYQSPGQGFGLGYGVTTNLAQSEAIGSVGQYYWSGAYCTYFFIDPEEDLVVILLSQLQPYSNYYGDKMRQFVYQAMISEE